MRKRIPTCELVAQTLKGWIVSFQMESRDMYSKMLVGGGSSQMRLCCSLRLESYCIGYASGKHKDRAKCWSQTGTSMSDRLSDWSIGFVSKLRDSNVPRCFRIPQLWSNFPSAWFLPDCQRLQPRTKGWTWFGSVSGASPHSHLNSGDWWETPQHHFRSRAGNGTWMMS